jgi:hypothetical protein
MDERLRVEEEEGYLRRIATHPQGYGEAGFINGSVALER